MMEQAARWSCVALLVAALPLLAQAQESGGNQKSTDAIAKELATAGAS